MEMGYNARLEETAGPRSISLDAPLMLIHPQRAVGPGTAEVHSIMRRASVRLYFFFFFFISASSAFLRGAYYLSSTNRRAVHFSFFAA